METVEKKSQSPEYVTSIRWFWITQRSCTSFGTQNRNKFRTKEWRNIFIQLKAQINWKFRTDDWYDMNTNLRSAFEGHINVTWQHFTSKIVTTDTLIRLDYHENTQWLQIDMKALETMTKNLLFLRMKDRLRHHRKNCFCHLMGWVRRQFTSVTERKSCVSSVIDC